METKRRTDTMTSAMHAGSLDISYAAMAVRAASILSAVIRLSPRKRFRKRTSATTVAPGKEFTPTKRLLVQLESMGDLLSTEDLQSMRDLQVKEGIYPKGIHLLPGAYTL
jgi:hypothetical protein